MIKKICVGMFFLNFSVASSCYSIKNKEVFYYDRRVLRELKNSEKYVDPDINTFEVIDEYYAKDKFTVYRQGKPIKYSDSNTFIVLGYGFSKDKNNVYKYEGILDGINSETFEVFKNQRDDFLYGYIFFRDINGIYGLRNIHGELSNYCQIHEKENNLISFNILKYGYVEYNEEIYFGCSKINGADGKTFDILDYGFSKDKNKIYFYTEELLNFDTESFKVFDNQNEESYVFYVKDKNGVYALIEKTMIPHTFFIQKLDVDFKTFEIKKNANSKDKMCEYIFEEEIRELKKKCKNE